eukprot:1136264-Pelagomonas_calceolata.AAC.7
MEWTCYRYHLSQNGHYPTPAKAADWGCHLNELLASELLDGKSRMTLGTPQWLLEHLNGESRMLPGQATSLRTPL